MPCKALDNMCVRLEALRELEEETGISGDPYLLEHLPRFSSLRHMCYLLSLQYVKPKIVLSDEHCDHMWLDVKSKPPQNTRYEVRRYLRDTFHA